MCACRSCSFMLMYLLASGPSFDNLISLYACGLHVHLSRRAKINCMGDVYPVHAQSCLIEACQPFWDNFGHVGRECPGVTHMATCIRWPPLLQMAIPIYLN